ncbi:ATP-grasp domain-containing protein [Chryseolinea lacunae]|uniref:ATP-grasp domain-containing protein n=1 Tax=Chryseolinea lacunae TaxID=2801331 RepID=A0ABS1L0B9_9BACT|nr:hypothetical protein [Chryseolinea lacunae]MBL0745040.1 hypothetical protein [Chryseolinea lacunae]
MFTLIEKPIGIFYGHEEWFNPLFRELERRELPYVKLNPARQWFDLGETETPYSLVYNDMSFPSYADGPSSSNLSLSAYFSYLEQQRVPVINGSAAIALQQAKVQQLLLLKRLGLDFPDTRVITHLSQLKKAGDVLIFPVLIKGNAGLGNETVLVQSLQHLRESLEDGTLALSQQTPWLVQQWIPAKGHHVVRAEVINGNFQYAVKLHRPQHDLDLRTADAEWFEPTHSVVKAVEAIAREARLEVASVEYAVDRRDNKPYFYAIHAHSNFVALPQRHGYDPYAALASHIEARLQKRREIELVL